jgi:RNA polymerase sigma-70 factor (ECF subfamily)
MGGHMAETEAAAAKSGPERSPEDRAIGEAIEGGDHRTALTLCARHHGASIGRLCMAMVGSSSEADDLVQETLLDAHAGFAGFRGDGSVRAWLLAIARRKCARHLERTARRQSRLRLVHDSDRGDSTEEMIERRRRAERARTALSTIRPSEREALVLRYASELSFREVGVACGVEEATARKRVSRALAKLRDAMGSKE